MQVTRVLSIGTAALLLWLVLGISAAQACEELAALALPRTTILSATVVPAGTFVPPDPTQPPAVVPQFCRVIGAIEAAPDSRIGFEVWLPGAGWNSKLIVVGNSGLAGMISYTTFGASLAQALQLGYAAASTDTGHVGSIVDGSWAIGHPEKIVDNAFRAVRETTAAAKAIVQAGLGMPARRAYFNGCSTGGRQALVEAQRFPTDFDGVIAGAPAPLFTRVIASAAGVASRTLADPTSYIPPTKIPALGAAGLEECDAIDGLVDGLVDDGRRCKFDPDVLLCTGADAPTCLTRPQARALRALYRGPESPRTGERLFPGLEPGGEFGGPVDWITAITGSMPGLSLDVLTASGFLSGPLFQDPLYDVLRFDFDRDQRRLDAQLGPLYNASPDLRAFQRRSGKILMYHGWSDAVVAPRGTIQYVRQARMFAGGRKAADSFIRLFMAPGMHHCGGGTGPFVFDAIGALDRWVETGSAPERILAAHVDLRTLQVDRTRPLCPFPQVARYQGEGSIDDAASFACVSPIEAVEAGD